MEKLKRLLNTLKALHLKPDYLKVSVRKPEKTALITSIADLVCNTHLKNAENFPPVLTFTVSLFLELLEDSDSGVRLVIDECLNRIVREVSHNPFHAVNVLQTLLTVLKKSNDRRTVKGALWRFAELTHLIRPQKGRVYIKHLVPVLIKLSETKDQTLLETLATSLPDILKYLGLYAMDTDIKVLLRAFLRNLYSDSAPVRRSSVDCVVGICEMSTNPPSFFSYVLHVTVDALMKILKNNIIEDGPILGLLNCIRHLLPHVARNRNVVVSDLFVSSNADHDSHYFQIYELCLRYSTTRDQNISAAALETFHQLLLTTPSSFLKRLCSEGGFAHSKVMDTANVLCSSTLSLSTLSEAESASTIVGSEMSLVQEQESSSLCNLTCDHPGIRTVDWVHEQDQNFDSSPLSINVSHFGDDDNDTVSEIDSSVISSTRSLSLEDLRDEVASLRSQGTFVYGIPSCPSLEFVSLDIDIGSMVDICAVPLEYCARHLCVYFLMQEYSPCKVRVSLISLALNCISQLLQLYPKAAFIDVHAPLDFCTDDAGIIFDVILRYSTHDDQQVRGLVCAVLSNFISAVLSSKVGSHMLSPSDVHAKIITSIQTIEKGLYDESAVCVRHALSALSLCLIPLLESADYHQCGIRLFNILFQLKDNPYWLVKVKVLEIACEVPFYLLYYRDGRSNPKYEERILDTILIPSLQNDDNRVRHAAAKCLSRFVRNTCRVSLTNGSDVITFQAQQLRKIMKIRLSTDFETSLSEYKSDATLEKPLSRIVYRLYKELVMSSSKYFTRGYLEALLLLIKEFPPLTYSSCWQCYTSAEKITENTCSLLDTVMALVICGPVMLHIDAHCAGLQILTSLFSALIPKNIKSPEELQLNVDKKPWHFLLNNKVSALCELFLLHLIRLCNIFRDIVCPVPVATTPSLSPSVLKSPLSPLDRSFSWKSFDAAHKGKSELKLEENEQMFAHYSDVPLYVKLHALLKSAYSNYKTTLKHDSKEKFVHLLEQTIECLAEFLEYVTPSESELICEQLLKYVNSFIQFVPVSAIRCITKLLKSICGTNVLSSELIKGRAYYKIDDEDKPKYCSLYDICLDEPYNNVSQFVAKIRKAWESDSGVRSKEYQENVTTHLRETYGKRSFRKDLLQKYLKPFESLVNSSLEVYMLSNDVELQKEVLALMTELLQLKVNFRLLDPGETFLKFLLSQFQYIEECQLRNAAVLLPHLFKFFVLLSCDNGPEPVIDVPKIIHLCDSLIASEQNPVTCISTLEPLIHHVFVLKSIRKPVSNETKELETQKDVLFTMMLKMAHYTQSWPLLRLMIMVTENEDKRLRMCIQLAQILFNVLVQSKIKSVDDTSFSLILNLLISLHPDSYTGEKLVDVTFSIYTSTHEKPLSPADLTGVLSCLYVLLLKYEETVLWSYIKDVGAHQFVLTEFAKFCDVDPLNIVQPASVGVTPAKVFARFLCCVIKSAVVYISDNTSLWNTESSNVLLMNKLLSNMLIFLCCTLNSMDSSELKREMLEIYYTEDSNIVDEINQTFTNIVTSYPVLVLHWQKFLFCLVGSSTKLGQRILEFTVHTKLDENAKASENAATHFNTEILRRNTFFLACVIMKDNIRNTDVLRSFLTNWLNYVIESYDETPVQELLSEMQSSKTTSQVFIDVINIKLPTLLNKESYFTYRMLHCLEYVHIDTYVSVFLLCTHPLLLHNAFAPIAKFTSTLAIRNAEYLLAMENRENLEKMLSPNELENMLKRLSQSGTSSRNLIALLRKICSKYYNMMKEDPATVALKHVHDMNLDEMWFMSQVKQYCCSPKCVGSSAAVLLNQLDLKDISSIMHSQSFNNSVIKYCFQFGFPIQKHSTTGEVPQKGSDASPLASVYLAARSCIIRHISHVQTLLPRVHQVYRPIGRPRNVKEQHYTDRMNEVFTTTDFLESLCPIIEAVIEYVYSAKKLSEKTDISLVILEDTYPSLEQFAILCSEIVHWLLYDTMKCWPESTILIFLECCVRILTLDRISDVITISHLGSVVSMLATLAPKIYNQPVQISQNQTLHKILANNDNEDVLSLAHSGYTTGILIDFICSKSISASNYNLMKYYFRKLVTVIGKYPMVHGVVRVPEEVWKHLSSDDITIEDKRIVVNMLANNILEDSHMLKQFVKRMMFIGWGTRYQFEESWVSLLTALNCVSSPEMPKEHALSLQQYTSVAINAVTSLLVQTLLQPIPGDNANSSLFHVSRNKILDSTDGWISRVEYVDKMFLRGGVAVEPPVSLYANRNVNIERVCNFRKYDYNQISVEYLSKVEKWKTEPGSPSVQTGLDEIHWRKEKALKDSGIDVQSCVHFLLDFYSDWFSRKDKLPLKTSVEVMKSMIIVSDLFTEQSRFHWLFATCVMLHHQHPPEDDILHQYVTLGICKSAAVAFPHEPESKDIIIKCLLVGLSSSYYPKQIACLHGLLYLLECVFKKEELGVSDVITAEFEEQLLVIAVNYSVSNLDIEVLERCSEHAVLCVVAIAFYLLENEACGINEKQIFENLCFLTSRASKMSLFNIFLSLMQGFYNLTLSRKDVVLKKHDLLPLIVEILSFPKSSHQAILTSMQLLVALMYASEFRDTSENEPFDADKLMARMEKLTLFFDRMKKGYRKEVEIIGNFLPTLLHDLFPPSEVLSKVIIEFLSPEQPHPDLMSEVVFKVFQDAVKQSQLQLLQEWVIQLLKNFAQGYSSPVATFCLTCFFISASTNKWLIALFPKVKARLGYYQTEDRKLLCVAAFQFYAQLTAKQKAEFNKIFEATAKQHPESPFADIVSIL